MTMITITKSDLQYTKKESSRNKTFQSGYNL
jgi:hypothetical protein